MNTATPKDVYFSGINGLRFLAALAVIITHIELLKGNFDMKNYWKNSLIFNLGGIGVYFFFVLSGFLITYLLLVEKKISKNISIKHFYVRRILRIWPLYYLILIIGFFVLPNFSIFTIPYFERNFLAHFNSNLLLYIFILPNIAFSLFQAVPNIGQAWSIGVEEQFYIVWPWIISKSKNVLKSLIIILFAIILIKIIVLMVAPLYSQTRWYISFKSLIAMSKFECMAVGGIGAYLLFIKSNIVTYIINKYLLFVSIIFIPLLIIIIPDYLQDGMHLAYSFLFLIIIINISQQSNNFILENSIMNFLGKISYGIYMYHFMVIPILIYFCKNYMKNSSEFSINIVLYFFTVLITIMIASISFYFFENKFIKLKSKFY